MSAVKHAHEWAVRLDWPNGSSSIEPRASERAARQMADWHNAPNNSNCAATVLNRLVTTTRSDWLPVTAGSETPHQPQNGERGWKS